MEKKEEINTNLSIQWVPIFTLHHWIRTNLFFSTYLQRLLHLNSSYATYLFILCYLVVQPI